MISLEMIKGIIKNDLLELKRGKKDEEKRLFISVAFNYYTIIHVVIC